MPAQLTAEESPPNAAYNSLVQFVSLATSLLLALLATWLFVRRLAGGITNPLETAHLIALSAIVAGSVCGLRMVPSTSPLQQRVLAITNSTTVFAVGFAFSLPGTTLVALIALWFPLIAEELFAFAPDYLRRRRVETPAVSQDDHVAHADNWESLDGESLSEEINQQWVRLVDESGKDTATGMVRALFAPTARVTSVHLGFCPPFAVTPEVAVDAVEGEDATVQIGQVLPYGARIELRRRNAGEPGEVVLQFFAVEGDIV